MTPAEQAQSVAHEVAVAGAKAAPAVSISAWHWLLERPVETWVSVAVLVFTVLQIIVLVRDKFLRDGKPETKRGRK